MKTFLRSASTLLLAAASAAVTLHAAALPNRLSRSAASTAPQALPQGVSPRLKSSTSLGHLSGDVKLEAMALVLSPSGTQSAALDQLLADQQNPASPRYHQWLTPAEFGAQFGISDSDLQVLQAWLTSQGFQVNQVAPSRNRITFSGNAAAVEAAFHTELNSFTRGGQTFFENSTAPQIPAALQNVVGAITGLSSYRQRPALKKVLTPGAGTLAAQHPNSTASSGSHYVTPWDFRQIYNANGLFNSGNTGAGVKIAVIGQSAVDLSQIADFQQLTGQAQKAPTLVLVPSTGVSTAYQGDETESESDLEYASGVAPGASVLFVYVGNSTTYNNGNGASVTDALNYAITSNLAPILTYSYGGCEVANTTGALLGQEGFFRQANAQGQTILVAAGDTGAAGCEDPGVTTAYDGLQVGYPASSPYVTVIGGTSLNDTAANWNPTNNNQYGSAVGYIPETAWNENSTDPLSSGGGGPSRVFGKPSWQIATGVPADSARDIPDISFTAAEHDAYLICTSDSSYVNGSSTAACTSTAFGIGKVGGTSLPTPAFAGALAMVLNANNNTTGLGNINPLLYSLNGTTPSLFHDVTTGSNIDPCAAGTLNCTNGSEGYNAAAGYDLATGLGSLDIGGFSGNITTAVAANSKTPTFALTVSSATTTGITVVVRASSNASTTVPTGNVTVTLDGGTPQTVALTSSTTYGAGVAVNFTGTYATGSHSITATYAGDSNFSAATASTTFNVSTANGGLALSVNPTTVTINSSTAHSGSWTLNFTSANGYTGVFGINYPTAATGSTLPATGCFLGQGDAGIPGNGAVTTTITYSFSASDCAGTNVLKVLGNTRTASTRPGMARNGSDTRTGRNLPLLAIARNGSDTRTGRNLPLLAIGLTGLLGSALTRRRRTGSSWGMTGLFALAAMAGTAGLSGCGSSSSSAINPNPTGGGTTTTAPKGTYNLVLSAGDFTNTGVAASTNVTLVIQ